MTEADVDLDCRGLRCPLPVIKLANACDERRGAPLVAVGQVVAVASTDVASGVDIPAWCRMREQEFLGESSAADGTPVYLVRRLR